jgi:hypothetical protein
VRNGRLGRGYLGDARSEQMGQEDMIRHMEKCSPSASIAPLVAEFTDGTDCITTRAECI